MTQKPQPQKITGLAIRPPAETAERPPPLASQVRVSGGIDVLTLEFFHVSQEKMTAALEGRAGHGVEVQGSLAIVRSEPLARVAIPLNVAIDLLGQMMQAGIESVPEIQTQIGEVMAETTRSARDSMSKTQSATTMLLDMAKQMREGGSGA